MSTRARRATDLERVGMSPGDARKQAVLEDHGARSFSAGAVEVKPAGYPGWVAVGGLIDLRVELVADASRIRFMNARQSSSNAGRAQSKLTFSFRCDDNDVGQAALADSYMNQKTIEVRLKARGSTRTQGEGFIFAREETYDLGGLSIKCDFRFIAMQPGTPGYVVNRSTKATGFKCDTCNDTGVQFLKDNNDGVLCLACNGQSMKNAERSRKSLKNVNTGTTDVEGPCIVCGDKTKALRYRGEKSEHCHVTCAAWGKS